MYWLPYLSERFRWNFLGHNIIALRETDGVFRISDSMLEHPIDCPVADLERARFAPGPANPVSYTHLRAHETPEQLVCRPMLEKKKDEKYTISIHNSTNIIHLFVNKHTTIQFYHLNRVKPYP